MACNGYNHHPSCNCGWGGVWYGGSSSNDGWLFNKPWTTRKLGRQPSTFDLLAANYTKPNVSCPVCGETVFYFRSRYGGRVYFDSLGPPWPKHPCTSSDGIPRRVSIIPWQEDEWRALSKVHIELISENKRTYSIRGESNGNINVFYCCSPVVITADIVRVKRVGYGVFSASMLYFEPTEQTWYVVDIPVFTSEKDAIEHGPGVSIESVALQQEECPFYLSTRYKQNSEKEKKNNVVKMNNVYAQHPNFKSLFDRILTSEDFSASKPDPDPYLKGAECVGAKPEECAGFEDSFNGLKSVRSAHEFTIGLSTTNMAERIKEYSDVVVANYNNIDYEWLINQFH